MRRAFERGIACTIADTFHLDVPARGGQPVLTAREGRQVLRFALGALESARVGRAVPIDVEESPAA